MTKDEALKLALEALELSHPRFGIGTAIYIKASAAIKEALAQPEQERCRPNCEALLQKFVAQRKPLTDEEIDAIADEFIVDYRIPAGSHYDFAQAIEAAHGIKG